VSCECGNIINPNVPAIYAGARMKPLNIMKKCSEDNIELKTNIDNNCTKSIINTQPQPN